MWVARRASASSSLIQRVQAGALRAQHLPPPPPTPSRAAEARERASDVFKASAGQSSNLLKGAAHR